VNIEAMKQILKKIINRAGFDLVRLKPRIEPAFDAAIPDFSNEEKAIIAKARSYTMTSVERLATLLNAVTYVAKNNIPGDIVECGVWRGGSMMVTALTLLAHGDQSRSLYLYDTFEGMSSPTKRDKSLDGVSAEQQLNQQPRGTGIWCYASLEDVRANLLSTGYPADKIHLIKGKVEDTIPSIIPPHLSLLRLDTDWYESTKHELTHLFPLLDAKGIMIIDDYGHWQGARTAVDEYFREQNRSVYLHRIDYTGRILVGNGTTPPANS
jgi:O-methyltransferase